MSSDQQIKAATQAVRDLLVKGDLLSAGLTHDEVRLLQHNLTLAGFQTDVDGGFGKGTAKSVMDFLTQRSQRDLFTQLSPHMVDALNQNGQKKSLSDMMAANVHDLLDTEGAMSKDQILQLQRGLEYATGQDLGTPDGVIGKNTRALALDFIQRYDRGLIGAGSGGHTLLDMNGSLLIGAEDDMIERFIDQAGLIPQEKRIAFLHEHADAILAGDAKRGGNNDSVIAQGQLMLRSLGYAAGSIDGLIGGDKSATRQAIHQFLKDNPAPKPDPRHMAEHEGGLKGEFLMQATGHETGPKVAAAEPEIKPTPDLPIPVRLG